MSADPARELLARIQRDHALQMEKEAIGWVVVVLDVETGEPSIGFATGLFATAVEAKDEADRMDADDRRWDEREWLHLVVPVLRPGKGT